jgi:hypothetical protein
MKNKEFLGTNLSQFRVWESLQMIYLPFIFNFLLFTELGLIDWANIDFLLSLFSCELGPVTYLFLIITCCLG